MEKKNWMKLVLKRSRIRKHRSILVVIGPEGLNQIPVLYKLVTKGKLDVLWCSEECEDVRKIDCHTDKDCHVTHCSYSEIQNIQSEKFNIAVIHNMEDHIRPFDLISIVESIPGCGALIFLFSKINEFDKLVSLKTSDFTNSRFFKRLYASLEFCPCSVILDDKLNVLSLPKNATEFLKNKDLSDNFNQLQHLQSSVISNDVESDIFSCLTKECLTADQARFLIQCLSALKKRTIYSTISASSPKGRGKSAALGLAIAGAIAMNYSNIYISSLNFDDVKIVFKFLFTGLMALKYEEDEHYDIIQSVNPKFNNALLGLNVFKDHPQAVRFIFPGDVEHKLEQAELVVIDEAAAIPLPLLKKLTGPYIVLMASTTEGCGASGKFLYESMVQEFRHSTSSGSKAHSLFPTSETNSFMTVDLNDPIFYSAGDAAERWINRALCLESCIIRNLAHGTPAPEMCRLFYVCRETLFSFENHSEKFLQQLMSLFLCSKRTISPDYLLKVADGNDYHIFCLLPPFGTTKKGSYEILCAILVHKEERIPRNIVYSGTNQFGNLHECFNEWKSVSKKSEQDFLLMQGIHIVDMVSLPAYEKMGYNFRALQLMEEFYSGKCLPLDDTPFIYSCTSKITTTDDIPLLLQLTEVEPVKVEYILVSYYLRSHLLKFWKKAEFVPVYISGKKNSAEEHLCLAIKSFGGEEMAAYMNENWRCFREYFFILLSSDLKYFPSSLALNLLHCKFNKDFPKEALTKEIIDIYLKPQRMKSLEKYCQNLSDLHSVMPCIPVLSELFFRNHINVHMAITQQGILLSFGLQRKTIDEISKDLGLPSSQIHGLLNRIIRKLTKYLSDIIEKKVEETIAVRDINMIPVSQTLDEELEEAAKKIQEKQKEDLQKLKDMDFSEYAIKGSEDAWEKALHSGRKTLVSIKSLKKAPEDVEFPSQEKKNPSKGKKHLGKRKR